MPTTYIAGADEAGRGCVIGPLVIGVFAIDPKRQGELKAIGAKDSKLLTPKARESLAEQIPTMGEFELVEISAEELTDNMDRKVSINELEAIKIAQALHAFDKRGVQISEFFADAPDPQAERFEHRIRKYYKGPAQIHAANKGESKWPTVAAASILAKVRRDQRIEEIKKVVGYDFGSGYSSDPYTVEYLAKHHNDPVLQPYLRHQWETVKRLKVKVAPVKRPQTRQQRLEF